MDLAARKGPVPIFLHGGKAFFLSLTTFPQPFLLSGDH